MEMTMKKILSLIFGLLMTYQVQAQQVEFKTSLGDFVVELQASKAPKTVC
jgi:hypothetical protein